MWNVGIGGPRLNAVLSFIANLITVVTPVVTIAAIVWAGGSSVAATILALYVCVLASGLMVLLLRQEADYRRESRYGPAMIPIRKAFNSVADASWTIIEGDASEEAFRQNLQSSLRFLAEAFSLITSHSCRASVKMLSAVPPSPDLHDLTVITLCRNSDDEEKEHRDPDRIGNNTDFRQIFMENRAYFFCNDLPAQLSHGYQNSHWDSDTIEHRRFDYVATIVWPIGRSRNWGNKVAPETEVIGFLCVDTLATQAFHETFDVPLGAAFAQAIYLSLQRYRARHLSAAVSDDQRLPTGSEG